MAIITPEGKKYLDNYKYVCGEYSSMDQIMNKFWFWLVDQLPRTLAPNIITVMGFTFIASSYLLMLQYDITLTKEIPNWIFGYACIAVFLYQTFDAMDGKQARRTNQSTPLGQLFDHGCDSYALAFFVLGLAQALGVEGEYVFYIIVGFQLVFFCTNWNEYHTHVLETQFGNLGVTEAQFLAIVIHFFTFMYGQQIWNIKIGDIMPKSIEGLIGQSILQQKLLIGLVYFAFFMSIAICLYCITNTLFREHKDRNNNKIIIKKKDAICQWIPILILVFLEFQIFQIREIFIANAGLMLICFGLLGSLLVSKLIVCSLTRMYFPIFHKEFVPFVLFIYFKAQILQNEQETQKYFVYALLGCTLLFCLDYVRNVAKEITDYLGIYCFSTKKRQKIQ